MFRHTLMQQKSQSQCERKDEGRLDYALDHRPALSLLPIVPNRLLCQFRRIIGTGRIRETIRKDFNWPRLASIIEIPYVRVRITSGSFLCLQILPYPSVASLPRVGRLAQ